MARGLHAEDTCVTEALVACWSRLLSAHFVDVLMCAAHKAAFPLVVDAQALAHLQARTGAAARSRGWELRVIDGVDATI